MSVELDSSPGPSRGTVYTGIGVLFIAALAFAAYRFGPPGVVLGLAAGTFILVIASFWSSLRTALGETKLTGADAFAIGSPRVEEEQKRSVLRALKDLEFERSVGKISDEDYKALVGGYRREAKRLLRLLDEASADQRSRAEKLVELRFRELGLEKAPGGGWPEAATGPAGDVASTTAAGAPAAPKPDAAPSADDPRPEASAAGEPSADETAGDGPADETSGDGPADETSGDGPANETSGDEPADETSGGERAEKAPVKEEAT